MGRVKKKEATKQAFEAVGSQLQETQLAHVRQQLTTFKENLEEFARKHKNKINRDPHFRAQFQQMCVRIGVDPLASNKGFWAEILGVGDFYYELGVQIVDVCIACRPENGGLMTLEDLHGRIQQIRDRHSQAVSIDDVKRAIGKLGVLGSGFGLLHVGVRDLVLSVPRELTSDHSTVLEVAQRSGGLVVPAQAQSALGWQGERLQRVLDLLLAEGMVWVDDGDAAERVYWVPSMWAAPSQQ